MSAYLDVLFFSSHNYANKNNINLWCTISSRVKLFFAFCSLSSFFFSLSFSYLLCPFLSTSLFWVLLFLSCVYPLSLSLWITFFSLILYFFIPAGHHCITFPRNLRKEAILHMLLPWIQGDHNQHAKCYMITKHVILWPFFMINSAWYSHPWGEEKKDSTVNRSMLHTQASHRNVWADMQVSHAEMYTHDCIS